MLTRWLKKNTGAEAVFLISSAGEHVTELDPTTDPCDALQECHKVVEFRPHLEPTLGFR